MNRKLLREARLWLIAIPIVLWTLIPIYHIFLFAISSKDSAFSGALWPDKPTLRNFVTVFRQEHFYLHHFWEQLWNSVWISLAVGGLTLGVPPRGGLAQSRGGDDAPWELLMAPALIYALPPAAIYYAFRRYMAGGLTAGAVKI